MYCRERFYASAEIEWGSAQVVEHPYRHHRFNDAWTQARRTHGRLPTRGSKGFEHLGMPDRSQ